MTVKLIVVCDASLQLTLVLEEWSVTNFTVIFKKVSTQDYRRGSLLLLLGKMTEPKAGNIIRGHMNTHCKEERDSMSLMAERNVCPFMPALSFSVCLC